MKTVKITNSIVIVALIVAAIWFLPHETAHMAEDAALLLLLFQTVLSDEEVYKWRKLHELAISYIMDYILEKLDKNDKNE